MKSIVSFEAGFFISCCDSLLTQRPINLKFRSVRRRLRTEPGKGAIEIDFQMYILYCNFVPSTQSGEVRTVTLQFEEALEYLREQHNPSEPDYRAACEAIADNLDQLPYRVFIHLPGGLTGNSDPAWDRVRSASEELCSCGNERVFEPHDMRHEFEPSSADPVIMTLGDTLYIRPVGAPASAAYMKFEIIDSDGPALTYLSDPMSTSINFADLFSTRGHRLADLVEPLRSQDTPPVLVCNLKHVKKVPLVAFSAVNPEAGTITLILDTGVEAFDPDSEKAHAH